ncbi:hypothetical protein RUND412_003604 [Rhizina undulata]
MPPLHQPSPSLASPSPSLLSPPQSATTCPACCSPDTTTTIRHFLFHRTTRVPLYVHPSLWSTYHLSLLNLSVTRPIPSFPATTTKSIPPRPPISVCPSALHAVNFAREYPPYDEGLLFNEILYLIDSVVCNKSLSFTLLCWDERPLRIGSIKTTITPHGFFVHHNLPFLAYSPTNSRDYSSHARQSRRLRSIGTPTPTDPNAYDIAIFLAMARKQHRALPAHKLFRVCLLSPNHDGTQLDVLQASVTASYLLCLRDLDRPLTELFEVARSVVPIEDDGVKLAEFMRDIVEVALKKPKKPKKRLKHGNKGNATSGAGAGGRTLSELNHGNKHSSAGGERTGGDKRSKVARAKQ